METQSPITVKEDVPIDPMPPCDLYRTDAAPPSPDTLALVDLDGDGETEFVLGSSYGIISVFKGTRRKRPGSWPHRLRQTG